MIQLVINSELVTQLTSIKDKKGISLALLAELAEIDEKYLSRILSGHDSPKLNSLNKIAEALNMKVILVDSSYVIK